MILIVILGIIIALALNIMIVRNLYIWWFKPPVDWLKAYFNCQLRDDLNKDLFKK